MSLALLYEPIYLAIVTLFTLIVAMNYGQSSPNTIYGGKHAGYTGALLLCVFLILFIGFRPLHGIFGDTMNYVGYYQRDFNNPFYFSWETDNRIFDNALLLFASLGLPISAFFTFIAAINFGALLLACKKLFPGNVLITFLICLGAFSTFSYGTNGIKAGAAASVFLLAMAYRDENKIVTWLLLLASYGLHHSMNIVVVAYVCSVFIKNTKLYFWGWLACVAIAALHIQYFQFLFAGFADEKGAEYLLATENDDWHYITGFRPDFILYSAVPIVIGYWIIFKKKIHDAGYELWMRMYLLTNAVWMVCMYASFANRIAYLSWFMLPIMIVYPFIKIQWQGNKSKYVKNVALYHLGFTLFMVIIYYNL